MLKLKQGVEVEKYGFNKVGMDGNKFALFGNGSLYLYVGINFKNELEFTVEIDDVAPLADEYYHDDGGFNYERYDEEVSDILSQRVDIPQFSEVLAKMIADDVFEK